jgi:hypothetical protein
MEGAGTLTAEDSDVGHGEGRRRRRRHKRGLSEKIQRSNQVARVRKFITVVVLGTVVVAVSMYVARNSTAYEPVPAPLAPNE